MLIGQRERGGGRKGERQSERRESITFQLLKSQNFRWRIRNWSIHCCYGNAILTKEPLTLKNTRNE